MNIIYLYGIVLNIYCMYSKLYNVFDLGYG